jgi:hypothetical protein
MVCIEWGGARTHAHARKHAHTRTHKISVPHPHLLLSPKVLLSYQLPQWLKGDPLDSISQHLHLHHVHPKHK